MCLRGAARHVLGYIVSQRGIEPNPKKVVADVVFRARFPRRLGEDHVWFEDRWMVASLCDE
jgi:hypothetical protein